MRTHQELLLRTSKTRMNLLWVMALTLANIVLSLVGASISFLFSATLPAFFVELGLYYAQQYRAFGLPLGFVVAGVVILLVYGLFFLLAKKRPGFLLGALIWFGLDTAFLLWLFVMDFDFSLLPDLIFHGVVLFDLIRGVRAWLALRRLTKDGAGGDFAPPPPVGGYAPPPPAAGGYSPPPPAAGGYIPPSPPETSTYYTGPQGDAPQPDETTQNDGWALPTDGNPPSE